MDTLDARLTGLALCWLLTRPKTNRGNRNKLEEALRPLVEHHFGRARWKEHCARLVSQLVEDGLVTEGKRGGLELAAPGRARVLRFLAIDTPPRQLTWKKLKDTYLQALSLGLPMSRAALTRVGSADGMRIALLQREHGLDGKDTPTLAQVRDRLLWRQLGVETDQPFDLSSVKAHLLGKMLELEVRDPHQAMEQLAARAAGAPRVDVEAVRLATLRSWLLASPEAETPAPTPTPAPSEAAFADQVLTVARALPAERRFGPDKVFIAHVWRALQPTWRHRESFDAALIEANRARHLSLSRADLVSVMDPTDVAESEIRAQGARFHFVVV
ncbi:hypothetical protein [Melittangium boletus]|uniref:Uncharacterized protein n=1 Tax=Melittangium boletus DSM 14713 TaxID=1294270 RepID=A0A250ITD3_9BACT|nr:hypothetical protein [Melittangium boletus]ATB34186.1 hypothetical protein MEBOL_007687 [Melittangium boletus DSM 14713]